MGLLVSTVRANMPLIRILLFALLLWVGYKLIRKIIGPNKNSPKTAVDYEDMVSCAHCGIHLPRGEAIVSDGKTYCSKEHAQASS